MRFFPPVVGFITLCIPSSARADVLTATLSNFVFAGNKVCGPAMNDVCSVTVNATFQWDTTTNTYVANSATFTVSANNTGLTFPTPPTVSSGPQTVTFGGPTFVVSLQATGNDATLRLEIGSAGITLQPGTYLNTGTVSSSFDATSPYLRPNSQFAELVCSVNGPGEAGHICNQDYFTFIAFPTLYWGADATSGTVTVTSNSPDGTAVGIYRSSNGLFLLNSQFNNTFSSADTVTTFTGSGLTTQPGDIPVSGDWGGTGTAKIGIYRPSTGTWFLDWNGNGIFDGPAVDRQYQYGGLVGDIPIVGDWSGTGTSKIGIFRQGFQFLLNQSGTGSFSFRDSVFAFGGATGCVGSLPSFYSAEPAGSCDVPIVGDWNKTGTSKVGVVRAAPGTSQPFLWILDTMGAEQFIPPGSGFLSSTVFAFGGILDDVPIVGDWRNTGNLQVGVFRDGFLWVEDTTISLPGVPAASDTLLAFPYGGVRGDLPIVGHW